MARGIIIGTIVAAIATIAWAQGSGHADRAAPVAGVASAADLDGLAPLEGGNLCGNMRCEPPEDCNSCPQDCGDCCGNWRCEPPEDCHSCPHDCGPCR